MKVTSIYNLLIEKGREEDKQQHFFYSFILFVLFSFMMSLAGSFVITFLIGLLKEFWDHYYGSGFCWHDMIANLLGIFSGLLIIFLFIG